MLITFRFPNPLNPEDENPIDCDSVPVLEDSLAAYGVKRNDTDAVVVAASTSMSKVSTGIYEYNFKEPALNLTYTYSVKATFDSTDYFFVYDRFRGTQHFQNELYATVAEFKTYIDYTDMGYTDTDAELEAMLLTASILIENYTNRQFFLERNREYRTFWTLKNVCLAIAARLREDPAGIDTNALSEKIGRYSYSGGSGQSYISGLTHNEYVLLQPLRALKHP